MKERNNPGYYKLLDITRIFCACLVVFIHMGLGDTVALIPCLTRQAVPFFFLVSGFFFSKRVSDSVPLTGPQGQIKAFLKKYIWNILIVYCFWALLWLPSLAHEAFQLHNSRSVLYVCFVVLRRVFAAGLAPYWYLLVLAEGSLILAIIIRFRAFRTGWFLCCFGIFLNVVYSFHSTSGFGKLVYDSFYTVFSWSNNVIMTGFPMMFLGSFLARKESALLHWRLFPVVSLYLVTILTAFWLFHSFQSLFYIPFGMIEAFLLFLICLIAKRFSLPVSHTICKTARNASSVIFLTHTIILSFLGSVLGVWDTVTRFLLTVSFGLLLTVLLKKWNRPWILKLFMIK